MSRTTGKVVLCENLQILHCKLKICLCLSEDVSAVPGPGMRNFATFSSSLSANREPSTLAP